MSNFINQKTVTISSFYLYLTTKMLSLLRKNFTCGEELDLSTVNLRDLIFDLN